MLKNVKLLWNLERHFLFWCIHVWIWFPLQQIENHKTSILILFLSFLFSIILWSIQVQTIFPLLFLGLWVLMASYHGIYSFLPPRPYIFSSACYHKPHLPHLLTAACSVCAPAFPWPRTQLWCPAARPAAGGCGPYLAGRPRTAPSGQPTPPSAAWRRWKAARFAHGTAPASSWHRWGGIPHLLPLIPTDPETCSGQKAEVM